ncbi:Methyltransferase domain-containing protein [Amycolatopsis xylanica]|uniref:Methyltransferase domain-containing protein n=1 Tax=Amycolatopsis xylanica TaxID=589385 RepID=A0A1H3GTF2_9PSEU|nr:class I SAM-dependent methyltransferase [Amycolatopsis xylanica]SDY06255.1 Methyltransferase domain-containing protein [Amycolatopsis xylanica]
MDPSLYAGSAAYYTRGRVAYPAALADALAAELDLDGSGRLLDVGCGPGSLTLLLAGHFEQAIGIDADAGMLAEAARAAVPNCRWLHLRAEQLPAGLGEFRLVTFAQSFHWLDRPRVAAKVRGMLEPGGACVHIHATTHQGIDEGAGPSYAAIADLVRAYLGPVRRAGQGTLPNGTLGGETEIYRAAGFTGPQRIRVPGRVVVREPDDIVASVFSLSSSAPHLFGDRLASFEADLRKLLGGRVFSERTHDVSVDVWRL